MKFFLTFLTLFFLSCNQQVPEPTVPAPVEAPAQISEEEVPHVASTPIGPEYPVANVKKVFTVKIVAENYTKEQLDKLTTAEKLIAAIFNSDEYREAVVKRKFSSTKLSGLEVYEKLFAGAEALQPALNYQMDLKVKMYFKRNNTVGYTYPSSMIVNTNLKYHGLYTACEVASNLVHEWTHKMGFDHATARDYDSVPYAHNAIVRALCPKFI